MNILRRMLMPLCPLHVWRKPYKVGTGDGDDKGWGYYRCHVCGFQKKEIPQFFGVRRFYSRDGGETWYATRWLLTIR